MPAYVSRQSVSMAKHYITEVWGMDWLLSSVWAQSCLTSKSLQRPVLDFLLARKPNTHTHTSFFHILLLLYAHSYQHGKMRPRICKLVVYHCYSASLLRCIVVVVVLYPIAGFTYLSNRKRWISAIAHMLRLHCWLAFPSSATTVQ